MNPELESSVREVLAKVLARDDFPAVLIDPVSTYLVTGRVKHPGPFKYSEINPHHYAAVYWLLIHVCNHKTHGICYYLREVRQTFKLYDS